MTTHTNRHRSLVCGAFLAAALALVATDAAIAGYGYGGGGGNKSKPKPKPKANVVVKVKRGDLVLKGSAGSLAVDIVPTADGLRVESRTGATKINGGDEPFLATGVTGDWKFKFGRAIASELSLRTGEPGVSRPRCENFIFTGGLRSDVRLSELDIGGSLKCDLRRTQPERGAGLWLDDVTVGADVKLSGGSDRTSLFARDTAIQGHSSMKVRASRRRVGSNATLEFEFCDVGSVKAVLVRCDPHMFATSTTFGGDVQLHGDFGVEAMDVDVRGDFRLAASLGEQEVVLIRTTVSGTALIATGAKNDRITLALCSFGSLDVRSGNGNDWLSTGDGTVVGAGSRYDGGKGKEDGYYTRGASDGLVTSGVELTGERAPPDDGW